MADKPKKPPAGVRGPGQMRGGGQPTRAAQTPGESGFRRWLNKTSLPLLFVLTRMPKWLLVILLAGLLLLGLILTGPWAWVGAVILGLLALFFAWLTAVSWPRVQGAGRLIRVLIVVCLAGYAVFKALGRMG